MQIIKWQGHSQRYFHLIKKAVWLLGPFKNSWIFNTIDSKMEGANPRIMCSRKWNCAEPGESGTVTGQPVYSSQLYTLNLNDLSRKSRGFKQERGLCSNYEKCKEQYSAGKA